MILVGGILLFDLVGGLVGKTRMLSTVHVAISGLRALSPLGAIVGAASLVTLLLSLAWYRELRGAIAARNVTRSSLLLRPRPTQVRGSGPMRLSFILMLAFGALATTARADDTLPVSDPLPPRVFTSAQQSDEWKIKNALSAAPAAIAEKATVIPRFVHSRRCSGRSHTRRCLAPTSLVPAG